ncbi:MAG: tail fiber protein [Caldilineaceae bacterium]
MAVPYLGEIRMFGGDFAPAGWAFCDGSLLSISANSGLFQLIGTTYGGDGQTNFALPDLRGRAPMHMGQGNGLSPRTLGERGGTEAVALQVDHLPAHGHTALACSQGGVQANPYQGTWAQSTLLQFSSNPANVPMNAGAIAPTGDGFAHPNMPPFQVISFIIALEGIYPGSRDDLEVYLGEIHPFSFGVVPGGWAQCNGQVLPIASNEQLFGVLGATYGGDGVTTFALPDLRGRMPMHVGSGFTLGAGGGEETHTLTVPELPNHGHTPQGSMNLAESGNPGDGVWATIGYDPFSNLPPNVAMHTSAIGMTGGNQPHQNMSPYQVVNFCIALQGSPRVVDTWIGEMRIFAGNSVPTGWLPCNGQILSLDPSSPYRILFSLLGTTYGGDGKTGFAVPDLQARVPLHFGQGPGLSDYVRGDDGGNAAVPLASYELAPHSHTANADNSNSGVASPENAVWGTTGRSRPPAYYAGPPNAAMNPEAIEPTGGDQPHNNLPPYLVLNFCIAYDGIFPQRPT